MDRKTISLFLTLILTLGIWGLGGCKKDQPESPEDGKGSLPKQERVWVVCEGNLGGGNGSLGLYDPQTHQYFDQVFSPKDGGGLGDVFESMTIIDHRLFLLMNNSDRIRVVDKDRLEELGTIILSKPRQMLPLEGNKAYVSSLYSQRIYVINTETLTMEKEISLPFSNAESMMRVGDEVWIACWDQGCRQILVLDPQTDQWKQPISINHPAPHSLGMGPGGKVWALSGNAALGLTSALSRIDLENRSLDYAMELPPNTEGIRLAIDSSRDVLYYIGLNFLDGKEPYGLFRLALDSQTLEAEPWISSEEHQYFWGLGLDPKNGDVYLADPRGFVQKGKVTRYNAQGLLIDDFETQMGPNSFYFDGGL